MKLTQKEREIMESIVTIGREDICMKELAYRLGISYAVMMRHRTDAMLKNGYKSWEGFLADYAREEQ